MPIALAGVLPVSAINLGLSASLGGLTARVNKLAADLSRLGTALVADAGLALNLPPAVTSYAGALALSLNAPEIAATFAAGNWPVMSADVGVDLGADLGFVSAQLAVVEPLIATLEVGLSAAGIAGWTYAGRAEGFGTELERATAGGFGKIAPDDDVAGVVIATETLESWTAFGRGVDVGSSASTQASSVGHDLRFLGELSGATWNSGVAEIIVLLRLLLAELRGAKSSLEASLQVSLGLNLPDVTALIDIGEGIVADIGIDGLLDNFLNVHTDVSAAISGVQAELDATLALSADITAQLSAGGLALWTYSGRAGELGSALRAAIAGGVPGGHGPNAAVYGLALAGTGPAMTALGSILKTS